MRRRTSALVLSVALACAACGSDDPTLETSNSGSSSDVTSSPVPTTSPTATASGEDTEVDQAGTAEPDFADAGRTDEQEGSGNGLSVVDVRTGTHDGYDRVVLELDGEGTPGWWVQYSDDPRTPGEGAPVDLAGDATLVVMVRGVGYPFDTGIEEYSGDKQPAPGLTQVQELKLGGVYEGQYDAFLGVSEQAPFRVFSLSDPARVVVDVQHP